LTVTEPSLAEVEKKLALFARYVPVNPGRAWAKRRDALWEQRQRLRAASPSTPSNSATGTRSCPGESR